MSRKLTIKAFKYNPLSKISKPHFVTYELEETPFMTVFVCLTLIREKMDADLSFDFVCRAGICGSCAMMINGVPKLACNTVLSFSNSILLFSYTLYIYTSQSHAKDTKN